MSFKNTVCFLKKLMKEGGGRVSKQNKKKVSLGITERSRRLWLRLPRETMRLVSFMRRSWQRIRELKSLNKGVLIFKLERSEEAGSYKI